MSRWDDERKERKEYEGDVAYEAWRRGHNPDNFTECAVDCYYDGKSPKQCVDDTVRRIRYQQEQREREEWFVIDQEQP